MRTKYSGLLKGLLVTMVALTCFCGESAAMPQFERSGPGNGPTGTIQIGITPKGATDEYITKLAKFSQGENSDTDNCVRGVVANIDRVNLEGASPSHPSGIASIDVFAPARGTSSCPTSVTARVTWVYTDAPKDVMMQVVLTGDLKMNPEQPGKDGRYYYSGRIFEINPALGNARFADINSLSIAPGFPTKRK